MGKPAGYLVERYTNMGGAYTCHRLLEEGRRAGFALEMVGVSDLALGPAGEPLFRGRPLAARDFALNRYKRGDLLRAVDGLCGRSYNAYEPLVTYGSKLAQMRDVTSAGCAKPRWLLVQSTSRFEVPATALGVPFVAKGLRGSMGREVWLVRGESDWRSLAEALGPDRELLCEEYVATSAGRDLRVYAVRGEAAAVMERRSRGDFRANVALGADVSAYPADADIARVACDVYACTGLDFCGIDLLFGADGYVLCEVNVTPGIEGIERATGTNVAGLVIDAVARDLS